jgi:septal ring-binding cell division protein DamX
MHRDVVADEIEQFKKYLLRGTPAVAMTPEDVASAEAAAKAAAEAASAASAAAQAQSEAQVASEPQAVASTASASASEASPKEVLPAATEPTPKETKTNRTKKSEDLPDEAWVKQLTDSSYVLQLSAADTEEEILKFKNSHPIYAKARVMSAPKKDSKKRYFILVAGPFENKTDADTYVNSHPLLSKGWLRNAKSMRNQFLRTQP